MLLAGLLACWLSPVRQRAGLDDSYYLLQSSSLVEDGDLDLRNDILSSGVALADPLLLLTRTSPNGALANEFSVGPAVVWSPAYLLGLAFRRTPPGQAPVRWTAVQRCALHLASVLAFVALVWFLGRLAARLDDGSGGPDGHSHLLLIAAIVLGTPLLVYATSDYTMSHLPSTLATALLLAAALALERTPKLELAMLAGAALGLCALIRWQDVVLGILLLVPLARPVPGRWRLMSGAALGFALIATLQIHAWHHERGAWLLLPQGAGYFHWTAPALGHFLLSGRSGLLTWSPIFALALLGLVLPWRLNVDRRWAWGILATLAAEIYLSAVAADWWAGHSFGARRLTSCVALLPFGLLNLRRQIGGWLAVPLVLCALWGLYLGHLYAVGIEDLSPLVRATVSTGAEEADALPELLHSAPEIRRAAAHWNLPRPADYGEALGGTGSPAGWPLTWAAILALGGALVAALARTPPRHLERAALASLVVVGLLAHLRLAAGPMPDPAERSAWRRLTEQWSAPPLQYGRETLQPPAAGESSGLLDAYRFVGAALEYRGGDPRLAKNLLAPLLARGEPAALEAERQAQEAAGNGELLRWIPGEVLRPSRGRLGLLVPLETPAGGHLAIAMSLAVPALERDIPYDIATLRGERGTLVHLTGVGPGRWQLDTPLGSVAGAIEWPEQAPLGLRLELADGRATLSFSDPRFAPGVVAAPPGNARELLLGRERGAPSATLRGAVFSDLVVVHRRVPWPG